MIKPIVDLTIEACKNIGMPYVECVLLSVFNRDLSVIILFRDMNATNRAIGIGRMAGIIDSAGRSASTLLLHRLLH